MDNVDEITKQLNERDLTVLLNAKNDVQNKIVDSPSSENVKALAAINKAIEEFQQKKAAAGDITFKKLKDVIDYLQDSYFGVKQSTVYYHQKKGSISARDSGFFYLDDVILYADKHFTKKDEAAENNGDIPGGLKDEAITKKATAQAEHWEIKTKILRGEYVERILFERGLAQRAAVFKSDIENFIRNYAGEMISLSKGDATRAPDVIEFWLDESEKWLARYAEDAEFEMPAAPDPASK